MATLRVYKLGSLNLKVSPMLHKEGEMIRSVNVDSYPFGAKRKRSGYITYLGTANGSQVDTLFNWTKADGTTFWNYRVSGGIVYYSTQGTGAWTVSGNGTLTNGARVGGAVLNETLIIGDGTANTRHTTSGTSFSDTVAAPKGMFFAQYQNRVYIGGTGSVLTYSVTNDATNWSTTGTSDSSSLAIPGAGKINQVFVANDRLVVSKNSGAMFRWDGYTLLQVPTNQGISAPYSLAQTEDFYFSLNRNGYFAFNGDRPQLISNPIERQIYNDRGSGIAGTSFDSVPATTHRYKYLSSVGDVTDDLTDQTVTNCVQVYDYQANEWGNYSLAERPRALLSFKDQNGDQQLIFGAGSQCYQMSGTATTDNGLQIETVMEGVIHMGAPESEKEWKYIGAFFNPGAEAKVQVAITDTYTRAKKRWLDLGDCANGFTDLRFPSGSRGRLLFWKVYEASKDARFDFYGFTVQAEVIDPATQ